MNFFYGLYIDFNRGRFFSGIKSIYQQFYRVVLSRFLVESTDVNLQSSTLCPGRKSKVVFV